MTNYKHGYTTYVCIAKKKKKNKAMALTDRNIVVCSHGTHADHAILQ